MKCPEDIKTYEKIRSDQKLFQFLNGLDQKFKPIKREILRVDPLPTAEAAYATVRKEATHQNILGATNNEPQGIATGLIAGETKGVCFVTKGYRRNDDKKKWCFRIVGYPDWWTDGNKKGNKSAKTEKEKFPTTNTSSINKENISDGRRSDGVFGGLATTGDKGIVSHVTKELNCSVLMHPTFCILQDIRTGWIIRCGTEREGLYYVDEVNTSGTVMLAHETSEREAWLWHRRLGHPFEQSSLNISATKDIIPNLISEVSNSQLSDSPDEIPKNIHETVGVQEHEEPTLTEIEEPTLTE
nr:hypothetical protein [Tanacetum cinerariifolium]